MSKFRKLPTSMTIGMVLLLVFFLWINIISVSQTIAQPQPDRNEKKEGIYQEEACYIPFPKELMKYQVYPWEILKFSEFSKPYRDILGSKNKEKWLRSLSGPSNQNKMLISSQEKIVVIKSCKQHYCDIDHIVIFYNPIGKKCWALLVEGSETCWLGNPDDNIKKLLKAVILKEFEEVYKTRQGRF